MQRKNKLQERSEEFKELIKDALYGNEEPTDKSIEVQIDGYWYNIDEVDMVIDEYLAEEAEAFERMRSDSVDDFAYDAWKDDHEL